MSQTKWEREKEPPPAYLVEAADREAWTDAYTFLADPTMPPNTRELWLHRVEEAGVPLEGAQTQGQLMLSVAASAVADYRAGIIDDAQLQEVMLAGSQALHEGTDDEFRDEEAIIAAREPELAAATAAFRESTEGQETHLTAEQIVLGAEMVLPAVDMVGAAIGIQGDGRDAMGDAARAMIETRADMPGADAETIGRQLERCEELHDADASVIEAQLNDNDMLHDTIEVVSDGYRDGRVTEHMLEYEVEYHLKPELDQVRAEHGYPQEDGHGE